MTNGQLRNTVPARCWRAVDILGCCVMVGAGAVLLGWVTNRSVLKSIVPGQIAMNPTTAVAFLVAGASCLLWERGWRRTAQAMAGAIALIGVAILVGYALPPADFGLDRLLFRQSLEGNQMAPNTALGFVLGGLALCMIRTETQRGHLPGQWVALALLLLAFIALLGYAYRAESFFRIDDYIGMALPTATLFILLSLAMILARPDEGVAGLIRSDSMGGMLARRLLPAALLLPPLLGFLRLMGERAGLYATGGGVAIMVLASTLLLVVLVWNSARLLHQIDRQRHQAQSELLEQRRQLEQANGELRAVNSELESFCYSVSHDLRTPLRGIAGFSEAVLEDCLDQLPEVSRGHLHRIRAAAGRMGQLIDDLLNLSRLSRQDMERIPVDLSATARDVVTELRAADPQRRVEVRIAPAIHVLGDPRLLAIAMENLLRNAWKFTSRTLEARIDIDATIEADRVVVRVQDNGAGFDMAHAGRLFGAFQRLHGVAEFPGTGIGLATVARVIHRHAGEVWAEAAVQRGATFSFSLPRV